MEQHLLEVKKLSVSIDTKPVLHDITLNMKQGETHVLLGPNGAGKSTLGYALMGNPLYQIDNGEILFEQQNITNESTDWRARLGMFLSFQNPIEVPGVTLESFIRNSLQQKTGEHVRIIQFQKTLNAAMKLLNMDESYATRDLNVGFSGGERKKSEILQLLMTEPKLAILDETDSGLDVDAVRTVSAGINEYQKKNNGSLLIITHSTKILESLSVDSVHILVKGRIIKTGDVSLIEEVNRNGFENIIAESQTGAADE